MPMAVVLVTGCSSGFGEAIALGFLSRGDSVVATMRRPEAAPTSLRAQAAAAGGRLELAALDVTDAASRQAAVKSALARHGRIDVLVNNAGVACSGSLEDTPLDLLRLVFETNFFGPHEMMRLVLPVMRNQGTGRIVNVTAIGAIFATPLYNAYCASKHAMDSISAGADIDTRAFGVRVVSVLPGQFKTAIGDKRLMSDTSPPYEAVAAAMAKARAARAGDVMTDLSPVVNTVIEAATHPDPRTRYAVGKGMAEMLAPAIRELDELQEFDLQRAGFR
jgi:NAD(P)-dependent dehydrogenase (short-subunit alcohol dehydrogenase family)